MPVLQSKPWLLLMLLLAFVLQGCGLMGSKRGDIFRLEDEAYFFGDPATNPAAHAALLAQYREWQGVPYRLGGNSKAGIDCSAFVQQTLAQQFKVNVPRSTSQQVQIGLEVDRSALKVGDLVFFRTGYTNNHVGFYLGAGRFMHASTRDGVTIANLYDNYWRKNFWTVRRVM